MINYFVTFSYMLRPFINFIHSPEIMGYSILIIQNAIDYPSYPRYFIGILKISDKWHGHNFRSSRVRLWTLCRGYIWRTQDSAPKIIRELATAIVILLLNIVIPLAEFIHRLFSAHHLASGLLRKVYFRYLLTHRFSVYHTTGKY